MEVAIKPVGRTCAGAQECMEAGDGAAFPAQIGKEVWIPWHEQRWRGIQSQGWGKVGCGVRHHGPQALKVEPSDPLLVQSKPLIEPIVPAWCPQ